jgi:hypothetical protein
MPVSESISTGASFDWRARGPEEAKQQFFKYLYYHPEATEQQQPVFEAGFLRGAQWAVRATSALSPSVAAMVAFVDWIHEHELEVDATT